MSSPELTPTPPNEIGFAPADYTDGRARDDKGVLQWDTYYPEEARKCIRREASYLLILLLASMVGVYQWMRPTGPSTEASSGATAPPAGNVYPAAFLSGVVGGLILCIKWHYHSVAKRIWHKDRLLWRLFTPLVSGVLAVVVILLAAGGVVKIFDEKFFNEPLKVIGLSFLVGYFSDKALAKFAEVADTLFGTTKRA